MSYIFKYNVRIPNSTISFDPNVFYNSAIIFAFIVPNRVHEPYYSNEK